MTGTALITGASSGFGEIFARRLAARGNNLVIVARRAELLEKIAGEIRGECGVEVECIQADLACDEGVSLVEARLSSGDVTTLVNNAGFSIDGTFTEGDISRQVDMVYVHDVATIRLTHAVLPAMLERGSGDIINVASLAGILPSRFHVTYSASKAFLVSFTETLSHEVENQGIRLQALCPGYSPTGFQNAMGRTPSAPGFMWQGPEQVVDESLAKLGSSRVVLVSGRFNKLEVAVANLLPRRLRLRVLRLTS